MRFESMRFLPGGIGMRAFLGLRCGILVHMITASVILDIPTQSLDTPYTYVVPDHMVDAEVGAPCSSPSAIARPSASSSRSARTKRVRTLGRISRSRICSTTSRRRRGKGRPLHRIARGARFVRRVHRGRGRSDGGLRYQGAQPGDGAQMPLQTHFGFGAQYEAASPETGFAREHASNIKIKPIERVLSKPYFR